MSAITMDGKYEYRGTAKDGERPNGGPARVLCVDAFGLEPVISLTKGGEISRHEPNGNYYHEGQSSKDLIEVIPPWEGGLWVHPSGESTDANARGIDPGWRIANGWRKIRAREVEP